MWRQRRARLLRRPAVAFDRQVWGPSSITRLVEIKFGARATFIGVHKQMVLDRLWTALVEAGSPPLPPHSSNPLVDHLPRATMVRWCYPDLGPGWDQPSARPPPNAAGGPAGATFIEVTRRLRPQQAVAMSPPPSTAVAACCG